MSLIMMSPSKEIAPLVTFLGAAAVSTGGVVERVTTLSSYSNPVPVFDFTSPISDALMAPFTLTSVRKFDAFTA